MRHELRRVDPMRAANVSAVVYGLLMTGFAVLVFPFFMVGGMMASDDVMPGGSYFAVFMLVMYPVAGVVGGWITGALSCVVYNLVVRWTGGLLVELDGGPALDQVAPAVEAR